MRALSELVSLTHYKTIYFIFCYNPQVLIPDIPRIVIDIQGKVYIYILQYIIIYMSKEAKILSQDTQSLIEDVKLELKKQLTLDVLYQSEYDVILRSIDGQDDDEIGLALNLTVSSVRQYRHNGKKRLKIASDNFTRIPILSHVFHLT